MEYVIQFEVPGKVNAKLSKMWMYELVLNLQNVSV
jgi:hypothetical protein